MTDQTEARHRMVEAQVRARGLDNARVLAAMEAIPREAFVPDAMKARAYEDAALPVEAGQTISQPYIVALMLAAADLAPADRVLEVGAGSGYAAAVAGRLAAAVIAIERDAGLASAAEARLAQLRVENVEVRHGDGTLGWPQGAPFDAILVSAGGPEAPRALKDQLAVGGRLVVPVGATRDRQRLLKLTRVAPQRWVTEDLGEVTFVPLVGAGGWRETSEAEARRPPPEPRSFHEALDEVDIAPEIARAAVPLPRPEDPAFAQAVDRYASAQVVLLGEASHGSSEFYRARAAITRRLITHHGFNIVAVEADWPDAANVNRFVRGLPAGRHAETAFARFPAWMWRNAEVAEFIGWLRDWNAARPPSAQTGFYGLDLYNLNASIEAVLDYLDRVDPEAAAVARERYGCLTPWLEAPETYGRMALSSGYAPCETAVVQALRDLFAKKLDYAAADGERFLDASQNARLVRNAERYYRAVFYGAAESWNLRDAHMFETLTALLAAWPRAKAVVWAHNSHIGDASKTEMGRRRQELSLGQLCRERFGADAALIGLGTHVGAVACASDWDAPMEVKRVNPSLAGSYERLAHDSAVGRFLLDLRQQSHPALRQALLRPRLERFIGVIYRPETERRSHYAECVLPEQFDAYVWFDETTPVTALQATSAHGADETWPFGL